MTTRQFYSEYWKPLFMTIIPVIILTGFSSYLGVRVAIAETKKDVQYLNQKVIRNENEFEFYKKKDEIQGEFLHRLEMNQYSMAKDCKVILPYDFKDLNTRSAN